MPGFDGTGPASRGAMTGRGMGYCVRALEKEQADNISNDYGSRYAPVRDVNYRGMPVAFRERGRFAMEPGRRSPGVGRARRGRRARRRRI